MALIGRPSAAVALVASSICRFPLTSLALACRSPRSRLPAATETVNLVAGPGVFDMSPVGGAEFGRTGVTLHRIMPPDAVRSCCAAYETAVNQGASEQFAATYSANHSAPRGRHDCRGVDTGVVSRPAPPVLTIWHNGSESTFAPGHDVIIGRDLRADVRIADPRISRAHLILRFEQGKWVAIDNGSVNGTFVNGYRQPVIDIHDGQSINIGNAGGPRLTFELGARRGKGGRRPRPGRHPHGAQPTMTWSTPATARRRQPGHPPRQRSPGSRPTPPHHAVRCRGTAAPRRRYSPSEYPTTVQAAPAARRTAARSESRWSTHGRAPAAARRAAHRSHHARRRVGRGVELRHPLRQTPRAAIATPAAKPAGSVTIGRAADNDIVVPDVLASRYHATLTLTPLGTEIRDTSVNGTFVNGTRVGSAILSEGDVVTVGNIDLVVSGGLLVRRSETEAATRTGGLEVRDVEYVVDNGKQLLSDISLTARPGTLTAVIGGSGAGKSTLARLIAGYTTPSSGSVTFEGHDIHAEYASLRSRIGMVPQDNVVHRQLTVHQALSYAAELRLPPDTSKADRDESRRAGARGARPDEARPHPGRQAVRWAAQTRLGGSRVAHRSVVADARRADLGSGPGAGSAGHDDAAPAR